MTTDKRIGGAIGGSFKATIFTSRRSRDRQLTGIAVGSGPASMKQKTQEVALGLALLFAAAGCDKKNDADPPPPAAPMPTTTAAPTAPPVAPEPTPAAPAAPPAVVKGAPEGIVIGRWTVGGKCNIEFVNGPMAPKETAALKAGSSAKV